MITLKSNLEKIKKAFSGPRKIFFILGVVLIAEIIYALNVLSDFSGPPQASIKQAQEKTGGGTISLSVPSINAKKGDTIPVSILIETGGHTIDGVDLQVFFDPKVLEATPGGLVKGNILDEYPLVALDKNKGLISISGISSVNKGYSGKGQFATLIFKAKASGNTSVTVDFNKGLTTDSNLVETGSSKDILETVDNVSLNVK